MSCEIETQLIKIFLETLDIEIDVVRSSNVKNTNNWDSFSGLNLVLESKKSSMYRCL